MKSNVKTSKNLIEYSVLGLIIVILMRIPKKKSMFELKTYKFLRKTMYFPSLIWHPPIETVAIKVGHRCTVVPRGLLTRSFLQ